MKNQIVISLLLSILPLISISQYTWIQRSAMPGQGRYGATGFSIGNKGYIGTGYNSSDQRLDDFWEYDQLTDVWTQKANVPNARAAAISFSINGFGYIGLGLGSTGHRTDLHRYNPGNNTWTAMASLPGSGRYGCASFSTSQAGYVVHGNLGSATGPFSTQLWKYDPVLDSWSLKAPFPGTGRYGSRAAAVNDKGYVIGGLNDGNQQIYYNSLHQYDPLTDIWTQLPNYPGSPCNYPVCFYFDDGLVVGSGNSLGTATSYFSYFDVSNNSWNLLPPLPASVRWAGTGFHVVDKGYVATGHLWPNTTYNDLWELISTVSTNELSNSQKGIILYPNPTTGILLSNWSPTLQEEMTVHIFDTKGELVFNRRIQVTSPINLSHLNKGIYLIEIIESSNHKILYSEKIIIK